MLTALVGTGMCCPLHFGASCTFQAVHVLHCICQGMTQPASNTWLLISSSTPNVSWGDMQPILQVSVDFYLSLPLPLTIAPNAFHICSGYTKLSRHVHGQQWPAVPQDLVHQGFGLHKGDLCRHQPLATTEPGSGDIAMEYIQRPCQTNQPVFKMDGSCKTLLGPTIVKVLTPIRTKCLYRSFCRQIVGRPLLTIQCQQVPAFGLEESRMVCSHGNLVNKAVTAYE